MITALTFVTRSERGHNIWPPASSPTLSYSAACAQGRARAEEVIDFMAMHGDPSPLTRILEAFPAQPWSGLEIGFVTAIGTAALHGRAVVEGASEPAPRPKRARPDYLKVVGSD